MWTDFTIFSWSLCLAAPVGPLRSTGRGPDRSSWSWSSPRRPAWSSAWPHSPSRAWWARESALEKRREERRAVVDRYLLVPVGEGHHNVERSQEQAEVEEGVAVGHSLLFVVHSTSRSVVWGAGVVISGQIAGFLRLHELVHLSVVGGADAVENNQIQTAISESQRLQLNYKLYYLPRMTKAENIAVGWFLLSF